MLILLGAGVLSLICVAFAWRELARSRAIESYREGEEPDPLEQVLLEREHNLHLGLAKRSARALQRSALFGSTGLSFWALTGGREYDLWIAGAAFSAGLLGWVVCGELHRRIGSMADDWRAARNRKRKLTPTRSGPA